MVCLLVYLGSSARGCERLRAYWMDGKLETRDALLELPRVLRLSWQCWHAADLLRNLVCCRGSVWIEGTRRSSRPCYRVVRLQGGAAIVKEVLAF